MSLGSEASSLRASIRAALLQKMSCLYEEGGAEGDGRRCMCVSVRVRVRVCVSVFLQALVWVSVGLKQERKETL